jgi:hypothetical protein
VVICGLKLCIEKIHKFRSLENHSEIEKKLWEMCMTTIHTLWGISGSFIHISACFKYSPNGLIIFP